MTGSCTQAELKAAQTRSCQQTKRAPAGSRRSSSKLDTNHDGQLSLPEFWPRSRTINVERRRSDSATVDANHDGKITADEFRAPQLAKFDKIDANHDGTVTPDEVRPGQVGQEIAKRLARGRARA